MIEELRINGNGFTVQPINPEDLILRFCSRLEFGEDTMRVANDAVRLVQRFNRDWMTPGRRPAGICGAAVIIAARMNNFRRTTREVVYIAKVAEATLQKRLDEFKATESSGLTVEEFRTMDLERFCDPPSFYERKDGKKRTRKRKLNEFDDDGSAGDEPRRAASTNPSAATEQLGTQSDTQQAAQNDSRSMPPPPIPIDPALLRVSAQRLLELQSATASEGNSSNTVTSSPANKKRGRPSKKPRTAATASATVAIDDSNPAAEIASLISPPSTFSSASALHRTLGEDLEAPSIPSKPRAPISNSEIISEEEFASDIEVKDCLLTPDEAAIKERIWTHENKDYLRAQQNKLIRQQLAEENGTARTIIKRKRRRKRMGDMSAYREEGDEDGRIAKTPAEAAMMMLKKRGFSKKINYETLKALYEPSVPSSTIDSNSNPSRRPSTTQEDSTTPSTPAPVGEDITSSTGNTTETTVQEAKRDTTLDEGDDDEHEEGDPDFWNEGELEDIQAEIGNGLDDDDDDDDGDLAEEEYDGEEYD